MRTLPALMNSSDMLACGEDLGMVPACVYPVLFSSVLQLMYSTHCIKTFNIWRVFG